MNGFELRTLALALALVWCAACVENEAVPALSPAAAAVTVSQSEPPASAQRIGPIQGTHGDGCGVSSGGRGTLEGATAALKEAAARRGASFVRVTQVITPYSGRDCVHQEYTLKGIAYGTPVSLVIGAASAPAPMNAPAPISAPAPLSAPDGSASACVPPCSPGYACNASVCEALCNPACAAAQRCRADRVCVP